MLCNVALAIFFVFGTRKVVSIGLVVMRLIAFSFIQHLVITQYHPMFLVGFRILLLL